VLTCEGEERERPVFAVNAGAVSGSGAAAALHDSAQDGGAGGREQGARALQGATRGLASPFMGLRAGARLGGGGGVPAPASGRAWQSDGPYDAPGF
jgi:hypothetical protein